MSEGVKLRVHLEFGELKADFEGDVNQVFESIVRFLTQIYPNLELLRKIVYTPDLTRLAEKIAGFLEITSDGPILVSGLDLPTRSAVCLALLGSHVGEKLGRMSKGTLSSGELAKSTGKAPKTVLNELPGLIAEGLVERTAEGEYRTTTSGIRRTEDIISEHSLKSRRLA